MIHFKRSPLALIYMSVFCVFHCFASAEDLSNIKWETNNEEPFIGSENAIRGGTIRIALPDYPQTFRLYGPNANDAFANWSREYSLDIALVDRHPTTDKFIPILATHWSVQDDHKTIYFKLDPDARWSDGEPITADDYVFADEFLRSPDIHDVFANQYMEDYFESVTAIDQFTIKIVGKKESWRALSDYNFAPLPRHATKLSKDWDTRENNIPPVVQGPYVISKFKSGESVQFTRVKNWWGDKKRYFTGMFNPDTIQLRVIASDDTAFDLFKKHDLDIYRVMKASRWAKEMDFEAYQKGYVHRKRIFMEAPQGMSGIALNPMYPPLDNRNFRRGLEYLFNFDLLNRQLMESAYYHQTSMFAGTEYENQDLVAYQFDPKKASQEFSLAGFDQRDDRGFLVNGSGQRAEITLLYNTKSFERHLVLFSEMYRRGGVKVNLQLLDGATAFNKLLERKYQASLISMTGSFYPSPYEYFSSDFKDKTQNNNFWNYGNPEVDKLINTYRFDMDETARKNAMTKLDQVLTDEALVIMFWSSPYERILYWDNVEFPPNVLPRRIDTFTDYQTFWINPEKTKRLADAEAQGKPLEVDKIIDIDPYGVKAKLTAGADSISPAKP